MEVLYDNPDYNNYGKNLPYGGGYQTLTNQIYLVCVNFINTHVVTKNDKLFCYLSMSLMCLKSSSMIKAYPLKHQCLQWPW